jgi:hypothetical protein
MSNTGGANKLMIDPFDYDVGRQMTDQRAKCESTSIKIVVQRG